MKDKYFGTDGIRGRSNLGLITPKMMIKLAEAISVANNIKSYEKNTVIIGKDTRLSGYMLEFALTSGFISMGVNVILVGPLPTPAVSFLVKSLRAHIGVMITASHNPYFDNGIKLFNSDGSKISVELEHKIKQLLKTDLSGHCAQYDKLGKATKLEDAKGRYIEKLKHHFPQHLKLDGVKIVVDCANGAAYSIAPQVFSELGADVITCSTTPSGYNINENCGVLSPESLSKRVVESKANIGIALDGDADRILIVDEKGQAISGDQIIALIATNYHPKKSKDATKTNSNKVVSSILSNEGLEQYLKQHDIELTRADVGDKYIAAAMRKIGADVGGEPSGHIILGDDTTTSDGIKVGLAVLAIYLEQKQKRYKSLLISQLLDVFTPFPQFSQNIEYDYTLFGKDLMQRADIKLIARKYKDRYSSRARIILRQSGTESVLRLLIECRDEKLAKSILKEMSDELAIALQE